MAHCLRDSAAKVLVAEPERLTPLVPFAPTFIHLEGVITLRSPFSPDSPWVNLARGTPDWSSVLERHAPEVPMEVLLLTEDICAIYYTSGGWKFLFF